MVLSTDFLVFAKLVMVLLFTLLIGPTTSHVLAKAAFHNGVIPKDSNNLTQAKEKENSSSII
jgi:multicomponent Na+:H+ antiporter subunit G